MLCVFYEIFPLYWHLLSQYCGGVDWRTKLDTQRGAVLAAEIKNNAFKLAGWTVCSILSGADQLKLGYVTVYCDEMLHYMGHSNYCKYPLFLYRWFADLNSMLYRSDCQTGNITNSPNDLNIVTQCYSSIQGPKQPHSIVVFQLRLLCWTCDNFFLAITPMFTWRDKSLTQKRIQLLSARASTCLYNYGRLLLLYFCNGFKECWYYYWCGCLLQMHKNFHLPLIASETN